MGWPADGDSVLERQWRALIADRVRRWRRDGGWALKHVTAGTALPASTVSELESGKRKLDVVDLARLAAFYGKGPADVAALFTPPTPEQWTEVRQRFGWDPEFALPPGADVRVR